MCNKTCIVAIVVSALPFLMLAETLVIDAQTYPTAQTAEPLLNVNLVYAYAQAPYATAILKVTRIADSGTNSSTTLADVYGINVFSNGLQVGSQEVVFLSNNDNASTTALMNLVNKILPKRWSTDYAPKKVGQSSLESCSIIIDNSAGNISVTVKWLERITIIETTSWATNIPIQNQTIMQVNLEKFNDGYLYNTIISQQQLSRINPFHPIANLPLSLQFITVNANGDITPSDVGLKRRESTYTVTENLSSTIIVEKDSVIIDGGNYTLQGPGQNQNGVAIILKATNITIENMRLVNWDEGVLGESNNNTIANNEFTNNHQAIIIHGNDYVVNHNAISNSTTALIFDTAPYRGKGDNNFITQNQITDNFYAFNTTNSNGTTMTTNNVMNNSFILALSGSTKNSILYSNNFINNSCAVDVPSPFPPIVIAPFTPNVVPISPAGQWDNGKIGNYWSDYQTTYPQATEIDHTGIGNTPYITNETVEYSFSVNGYAIGSQSWAIKGTAVLATATDNYPLIAPISIPTITLTPPSPTASPLIPGSIVFAVALAVVSLLALAVASLIAIRKISHRRTQQSIAKFKL